MGSPDLFARSLGRLDIEGRRRQMGPSHKSTPPSVEWKEATRLEQQLAGVRWLAAVFVTATTLLGYRSASQPHPPGSLRPGGVTAMAFLCVANAFILLSLRRRPSIDALRRLGRAAFALDVTVVFVGT